MGEPMVLLEPGFPPVISNTDWMVRYPCGCFVAVGWDHGKAVAVFHAHGADSEHAAPMRRATERYAAMLAEPVAHAELAQRPALGIIDALAADELHVR